MDSQGLSESIDDPDGWLDALMQVAVCDKVLLFTLFKKSFSVIHLNISIF